MATVKKLPTPKETDAGMLDDEEDVEPTEQGPTLADSAKDGGISFPKEGDPIRDIFAEQQALLDAAKSV